MADLTKPVKVARSRSGSDSLKITIPHAIAEIMKLKIGDMVVWELDKVGEQVFVTVRKEVKKE